MSFPLQVSDEQLEQNLAQLERAMASIGAQPLMAIPTPIEFCPPSAGEVITWLYSQANDTSSPDLREALVNAAEHLEKAFPDAS